MEYGRPMRRRDLALSRYPATARRRPDRGDRSLLDGCERLPGYLANPGYDLRRGDALYIDDAGAGLLVPCMARRRHVAAGRRAGTIPAAARGRFRRRATHLRGVPARLARPAADGLARSTCRARNGVALRIVAGIALMHNQAAF